MGEKKQNKSGQVFYVYVLEAAKLPSVVTTEYHSSSLLSLYVYVPLCNHAV